MSGPPPTPNDASTPDHDEDDGPPVLSLIKAIQSGQISPKNLSKDQQRACVEYLTAEYCSKTEIGDILKISDRTVARYRQAIREANAFAADVDLTPQVAGVLLNEAYSTAQRLGRLAREKGTPAAAKVAALEGCYRIHSDVIRMLQRLGYVRQVGPAGPGAPGMAAPGGMEAGAQADATREQARRALALLREVRPQEAQELEGLEAKLAAATEAQLLEHLADIGRRLAGGGSGGERSSGRSAGEGGPPAPGTSEGEGTSGGSGGSGGGGSGGGGSGGGATSGGGG